MGFINLTSARLTSGARCSLSQELSCAPSLSYAPSLWNLTLTLTSSPHTASFSQ